MIPKRSDAKARALLNGDLLIKTRRERFSREQVLFILEALGRGETTKDIGRQFGVGSASIRKVRCRERRAAAQRAEINETQDAAA